MIEKVLWILQDIQQISSALNVLGRFQCIGGLGRQALMHDAPDGSPLFAVGLCDKRRTLVSFILHRFQPSINQIGASTYHEDETIAS